MKKLYTFRRILSAVVILMMSAFAWAYDFQVDGVVYTINHYAYDEDLQSVSVTAGEKLYSGDVVIPASVTYEGITYSVTRIENEAFEGCHSLTSISIPESVTSIGNWTFYGCRSLTSISIPEGVTEIGRYTFSGCSSLTYISIPKNVASIGGYAFMGCSSLTSISIPDGVKSIGDLAFAACSSLTSFSIPGSVTSIGLGAFSDCFSLTSVICYVENILSLDQDVFYQVSTSNATLYVPASAIADYKTADQWKDFGRILPLEDIPASISNTEVGETNAPYYTIDGIRVDNPTQKGIYIKNGKKVVIK